MKKRSEPTGHAVSNDLGDLSRAAPQEDHSGNQPTSASCSLAEIRLLAQRLHANPVPLLTKRDLIKRWKVGKDVVRKMLRAHGVDPGQLRDLTVPLTDALHCEGVEDPLSAWAMGTDEDRAIFEADLLTLRELRDADNRASKLHIETYRRHARDGQKPSIRIGKQHRFRPQTETIENFPYRKGQKAK